MCREKKLKIKLSVSHCVYVSYLSFSRRHHHCWNDFTHVFMWILCERYPKKGTLKKKSSINLCCSVVANRDESSMAINHIITVQKINCRFFFISYCCDHEIVQRLKRTSRPTKVEFLSFILWLYMEFFDFFFTRIA